MQNKNNIFNIFKPMVLYIIGIFVFLFAGVEGVHAATRYSVATGNWSSTSTWAATSGGTAGVSAPVAGDIVYIEGAKTVTTTAITACADVNIATGSALTIGGFNFTSTGTTTISGTLTHSSTTGTKTFANVVIAGGTWTSSAAEAYAITNLTLSGSTINGASTGLFTVSGTMNVTTGTTNTLNALTITVTGTTTVQGTLIFASTTGTKTFAAVVISGGGAWTSNAAETYPMTNLTLAGSTVNGSTSGTFTVSGNLAVSASTTNTLNGLNLTVNGTTAIDGSLSLASTTGTKIFTGLTTISGTGSWLNNVVNEAVTFRGGITNNGTFTAGTGLYTFDTNVQTFNGTLSIPNVTATVAITNNANLTVGTALTATTFTNSATGTLNIGGTSTITTLTATAAGNTVNYYGAAQTVKATTYNNLTLSGSGTKTTTTSVIVSGLLSIEGTAAPSAAAPVFTGTAYTLQYKTTDAHIAGAEWVNPFVGTGGVIIANTAGSVTLNSAEVLNASIPLTINSGATLATGNFQLTLGGNFVNGGIFTAGSSPIVIAGTAATQSIAGFTTTGLVSMTKTAGTATFASNVNGAGLTINGTGGTLNLGTGLSHSFTSDVILTAGTLDVATSLLSTSGNWTNNGGTFIPNASTVTFNGNTSAINGTAATQTFNNIIVAKTTGQTLSVGGSTTTLNVGGTFTETTGNFTAPATMAVTGDLTMTAGTFTAGTNLSTSGNWINNGATFTPGAGTVSIIGAAKNIGGSTGTTFNNLTINNASGASLGNSQTVNGTLTLTSGLLSLGANNLTLGFASPAVAGTLNASNMIVTDGAGVLRKLFTANGSYTFPVGETTGTTEYSPITLNFASGTYAVGAYAGIKVVNAKHPNNSSTTDYLNRYWTLSQSGITSFSTTATGTFVPADVAGSVANMTTGLWTGALPWQLFGAVTSSTITAAGLTTIGDLTGLTTPSINNSATTLTGFTYISGSGPSTEQSYTVSGSSLVGNLVVSPPTDYEISLTTGGAFVATNPISLTPTSGTVAATTIYVRLKAGLAVASYNAENIASTSTGVVTKNVAASGTVTNIPLITNSVTTLTGYNYFIGSGPSAEQSYTVSGSFLLGNISIAPSTNYEISLTTGGAFVATNPITLTPTTGTVAATTIYVRLKAGLAVASYTAENIVATSTSAVTKNVAASGSVSNIPLISNSATTLTGLSYISGSGPSSEQSYTVSGSFLVGNISVAPPTDYEISLTTGGAFVATNPITLTPTTGTVAATTIYVRLKAGLAIASYNAENIVATSTSAVTKNVAASGTVTNIPLISTSVATLTGFAYNLGAGPSAQQSFTVGGTFLIANITVTPSTNFEISTTSGSGFISTPITLTQSAGTVATTTIYVRLKAGLLAGSYTSENIASTSTSAVTRNVAASGTVFTPTITNSVTTLTGFSYITGSGPSSEQTFTTSAVNLIGNLVLTPSTDYEISLTTGGAFVATNPITLTPTTGTVGTTTIYVRLKAGLAIASYNAENIAATSTNAVTKNVAASGSVNNTPLITNSAATLTGLSYISGSGPSAEQSYTVGGTFLVGNISVTPPTDYEISLTTGGAFVATSPITLTPTTGTVAATTIYVRLKAGLAVASYNAENIAATSTSAVTKNVAASGTVTNIPLITNSAATLTGFAYISGSGPSVEQSYTVGGTFLIGNISVTPPTDYEISLTTGGAFVATNPITLTPTTGTVAATTIYVRLKAGLAVASYNAENIAATSTSAVTKNVAASGTVTNIPLITNSVSTLTGYNYITGTGPSAEQSYTVSGSFLIGNLVVTPPTDYEISLTTGGAFVATNPITLTPTTGTVAATTIYVRLKAGLAIASYNTENIAATSTSAVTKNVAASGTVTNIPLITNSVATLTGFTYIAAAGPSAEQSYTVGGTFLVGNISVTPPTDYEISLTTGGAFVATNPITLTPTTGTVAATTIYVRLKAGLAVASYNAENIAATSTSAVTKNVAASGTVTINGTFTSTATGGPWATGSTWIGGVAPGLADNAIIATTGVNTVDIAANFTQTSIGSVTVNNGARLTMSAVATTNTFGALTINTGGIATLNAATTVLGATSVTGTINFGSTNATSRLMTFSGTVTLNSGAVWNETATAAIPTFSFGNSLTNNATTFTTLTGSHTFTGTGMTIGGATTTSIQNVAITGTYTNNNTLTVATALTGTGGLTNSATGILNIGGTSTITTLTATATFNTVNYNGAAQTVFNTNYYDLKLSGSGAKTLQTGTTAIGGSLTLSGTANTTGVIGLSIGNDVIIGSGTTFTSGAFTHNVAGNWTNTGGTFTSTGGTINFTGNSTAINGTAATQTFNNIIVAKTTGQTLSVGGSTTTLNVGGTFTETSGNFTAPATMTITGNNTLTAGTFTSGANLTFNGATWTNTAGVFAPNAGTVTFGLGGAQTLSGTLATTFNNLTVSTSGLKTLTTVPTVNGIFSLSGTATVSAAPTYGSAATLQYNTTTSRTAGAEWITPFVASGGVIIGSTGTITMNAAKVFNSTAPLTINSGSSLAMSTFLLTLNGNFINNGGTTTGTGGVTITGTATQSIGSFTNTGTVLMTKTGTSQATLTGNVNAGALTINGTGGTLNLGTGLTHTFSADVTLTAGALNGGSSTLNENATSATAWNGTGSLFTAGTGTVSFGGVAQTLAATATTFNNLTIAGGGAKTLSAITTVSGTLTLTSGLLTLGTNNLILGASSPAVAGTFSATNMIVTNSTGAVQKLYTANGSYLFPIGETTGTTEYSPVTLNFVSGTYAGGAYATARVTNAKQSNNTSVSNYLNRYWTVAQSGITSFSANVTGTYLPADIVGLEASTVAALYPGALPWVKYSTLASNTLTANGVTSFGDFSGVSSVPVIVTSVASLTGFSYPVGFGPSTEQTFTVSGSDLAANMTVTAPTNFEISTGTGASFVATSPITLTAVSGAVPTTTIYVRMKTGIALGTVAAANVVSASTGATSKNVSCSGTVVTAPVITTSVSTLSGFTVGFTAGPSAQQSYTVSGTNLVANVIVSAPTDYEISTTSGSGFVSTFVTLTPTTGTLAATTIYVRLKNTLGVGSYVENVVASSTSALSKNVSCSGTVTPAPTLTTSTSYLGGFIYATTGAGVGPSGSQSFVVTGSGLTANVTVLAPDSFEISTNNTTFVKTIALTQSGGAVSSTIYARLKSGKAAGTYGPANVSLTSTGAVVKTVAFAGSVVATATIATTKSTITGFGYLYSSGGPSSEQTFTVSGALLTANIIVTPPTNYEISTTSGSGFVSTAITLTQTSGRVNPTPIYVRLKSGLAAGNYTGGNITVASTGITTKNVSCVGIVFISPLVTAGGGGTFCAGSTINLTSVGADILNRYWNGPSSYYSTSQNPTITSATTDMTGTYTVTGNVVVGGNLITNGDFESGNTSFGSSYLYAVPGTSTTWPNGNLWPEGYYTVDASPQFSHTNFSPCPDHTTGGATPVGKQMIINGASTAGVVIWSQSVPVIPGASYEFTYWVQTVVATSPSQLQLYVNGVAAGPIYTADLTTCTWKQFIYNTSAGSNTSLNLELINENIIANGNDFALDDIVFQQILPATSSVDVTVNPVLPVSVTVAASANPVYSNTPVTFTATPTNGGLAPAYQWKVNGVAVSGATNVTYTYAPKQGDIVLCELTSSLSCVTNNPATANVVMTVITRVNYWYGYNSTDWGTASNWTANYVPLTGDDVEYATVANFGSTAIRDLQLDINRTIGSLINATTKRLLIPANKGLLVNNNISTDNNPDRIYIYSSSTLANGSLSYHNIVSNPVYASVEMYSKASWDLGQIQGSRYQWQYFGIPLRSQVAYPQFTNAYVRKWYETGTTISNHWIQLPNDSVVHPYYGYELCQQYPKTYLFKGALENGNFSSGQLAITSGALYPGQHVFANPYTAAIDIKQLAFGTQTEATVYLYHTGTYNAWTAGGETAPGTSPGYYLAVPKNLAGDLPGVPRQVPSMQAMLVKAMTVSSSATFGITYNSVVMNNTDQQRVRANNTDAISDKLSTMIELKGTNSEDKLWLLADPNCTRNFDNGWDGFKIAGSSMSPQIFAMEKDGNYQVNAVDDINDIDLGFQAGIDSEYTLNFTHQNLETKYAGVYLVDLLENKTIDITQTGSVYAFTAKSTPTVEKRFKIVTRYYEKDAPDGETQIKVFSANGTVFVQNLGTQNGELMLYNMSGRFVKRITFAGNTITAVANGLTPGAYVAKALTNNEEVSKRIIVR